MISSATQLLLCQNLLKSQPCALLEVFSNTTFPNTDIFEQALKDIPWSPYHHVHTRGKKNEENESAWRELLTNIPVDLTHASSTFFIDHLLQLNYFSAVAQVLKNTSLTNTLSWLNVRRDSSMFHKNGHDRCSNLGVLVQANAYPVLDALFETDPTLLQQLDWKGRSALFYARCPEMVAYLVSKEIDPEIKDKDGLTAMQTWSDVLKSPDTVKWIAQLGHLNSQDTLFAKIFSLDTTDLTSSEQKSLDSLLSGNAAWNGTLFGVERQWTPAQAWDWAVLLQGLSLIPSKFDRLCTEAPLSHFYKSSLVRSPKSFANTLGRLEQQLSISFQEQLNSPSSPVEQRLIEWMYALTNQWDGKRSHAIGLDEKGYKVLTQNSYQQAYSVDKQVRESLPMLSNAFVSEEYSAVGNALASYAKITDLWENRFFFAKLQKNIEFFVKPPEHSGVMTGDLSRSIAFLRLGEGARTLSFANIWNDALVKNRQLWESDVASGNNLQMWSPILQLGLSYSVFASQASTEAAPILSDMLSRGVEIEKIPLRFAKAMPEDLRAAATHWILQKSVASKIDIEELPVRKRRM